MLPTGSVIGILGGGQLGRMIALAAATLGYRAHIYSDCAECPARYVTPLLTVADYQDEAALAAFAAAVDVITLEFENIPLAAADFLAARKPFYPSPKLLAISQNRLKEKTFCQLNGAPTTPFLPLRHPDNLDAVTTIDWPSAYIKTASSGYDGKGQIRLDTVTRASVAKAWEILGNVPCILEQTVPFTHELSAIVARAHDGQACVFPIGLNTHKAQILRTTLVPAPLPKEVQERAVKLALILAEKVGLVGLLAVEMFVTAQGDLLVNELAPRPHNSGHWTMDGCATSQFEQLVRCVAGLPLGNVGLTAASVTMNNLIGDDMNALPQWLTQPNAKVHLYDKPLREGRKMGHVNVLTLQK